MLKSIPNQNDLLSKCFPMLPFCKKNKNNTISLISLYASVENKTNFCTSSRIVYLNLILSLPLCIDGRNSVIPNSLSVIQDYV